MRRTAPAPRPWLSAAACRGQDREAFFDQAYKEEAVSVCASCPVRTDCLDYAINTPEQFGVWGGMDEDERARERRRRMRGFAPRYHPQDPVPPRVVVHNDAWTDPHGSTRRTQALGEAGHTAIDVVRATGLSRPTVTALRAGTATRVRRSTAELIAAVYPWLLEADPGPGAAQRREQARARGWLPAAAWEGLDIDDPHTQPRSHDVAA